LHTFINSKLLDHVMSNYALDLNGIHGKAHWSRVRYNGVILHNAMNQQGYFSDRGVIELFAFIHDSHRELDHGDEEHGIRAAEFCKQQNGNLFNLSEARLQLLYDACFGHTTGLHHSNLTVQICWDSDRLDIGRCKEFVDPYFLGTPAAKSDNIFNSAVIRSRNNEY